MSISSGRTIRLTASLACAIAVGWAAEPTAEEQRVLQATVSKLTQALNARNVEAMLPRLAAEFSAFAPMAGWWGTKRLQSDERAREQYRNVELATLVRSLRMVTPEVALGDGFFRTIGAPGGDASGRVYLVLTKTASHWQVLSARFAPRPTDPTFINIEPAKEHAAPGPDGWVTLFDGKSLEAFEHPANPQRALTWKVVEGTIAATPGNGQAGFRTKDTYRSFELRWEWKLPEKGNSGVKYQLFYLAGGDGAGHEYQLADDNGDPGAKKYPVERTGSLYNQIAPSKAAAKPIGEWNSSVLIVKGRQCEHWLNGEKVVEYETESSPLESPILFQHHTTEAWFRNIRIKRLD